MASAISRRRFIGITAAAAGLELLPFGAAAQARAARLVTWQGMALGASASLQIHHSDHAAAERLIERALAEVRRLEGIFSLYRDDSSLAALNRTGILVAPPAELVALLTACRHYHDLTGGAFDTTVQPLWWLYLDHFSKPGADPAGPPRAAVAAAVAKIGADRVLVGPDRVAFARRGMAVTLNGIAQGFVTDRVVDLLRAEGIERSFVDLGESRALGERPEGGPWRVRVEGPDETDAAGEPLSIVDQAVATSGSYGFRFDPEGRFNHLFDPRTGGCAARYRSLTVVMPTATAADALSTAFSLMPPDAIRTVLRTLGDGEVHGTTATGERLIVTA